MGSPGGKALLLTTRSDSSRTIFSIRFLSPATVPISPHTQSPYVTASSSSPDGVSTLPHFVRDLRITNFSLVSRSSGLVNGIMKLSNPRRLRMMSWYSSGPVLLLCSFGFCGARRLRLRLSLAGERLGLELFKATMNKVPSMLARSQITVFVLKV